MKSIQYIAAIILITLLFPGSIDAQKYFKVIDATSMSWAGGVAQTGSGMTYDIKIVLLTNQKVSFNEIWIGKEYGSPEFKSFSYSDGRTLVKGDTAIVRYTVHHYPPGSPLDQTAKPAYKAPPIPIQGEALLGFRVGKATRYRSVEKFKAQPAQNYP